MPPKPAKTVPFSPMRGEGTSLRNTLNSPFQLKWPDMTVDAASAILTELKSTFTDVRPPVGGATAAHRPTPALGDESLKPPAKRVRLEGGGEEGLTAIGETKGPEGRYNRTKRSQLVVGTNAVSRLLERNGLRAGVVCPSARPPLMHRHLLMMSASRGIPFAAVPCLSEMVAPLLGLKTALAIGFKKLSPEDEDHFKSLLSTITAAAPPIIIPWLTVQGTPTRMASEEEGSATTKGPGGMQEEGVDPDGSGRVEGGDVCEGSPHDGRKKQKTEMGVATETNDSTTTPPQKRVGRKACVAMVTPPVAYHPLQIKRVIIRSKKRKRL